MSEVVPPPGEFDGSPDEKTEAPPRSGARLRLIAFTDPEPASFELPRVARLTIGRADQSDLTVKGQSISRAHAALYVEEDAGGEPRFELEDLGSANGTRVRGRALEKGERCRIMSGEVFDLGSIMMMIQGGSKTAAPRPLRPRTQSGLESRMDGLFRLVERVAPSGLTVLILGETGAGKEVMAERIHAQSGRASKPFLRLNCAALAQSLLESELFGHEKNAFTGAEAAKPGLFESAEGGTVFLDEIGELPASIQVKLLRVLEERKVLRVGGREPRALDVRFIAATNRDLEGDVARGSFRSDLFYRLNGVTLSIPPLRERRSEIAPLSRAFASGKSIAAEAMELLEQYDWPGNVRELKNVIERAVLLAGEGGILCEHLPVERLSAPSAKPPPPLPEPDTTPVVLNGEGSERERIIEALAKCVGNQTHAAALLGISRSTLVARLNAYQLPRPRKR